MAGKGGEGEGEEGRRRKSKGMEGGKREGWREGEVGDEKRRGLA